MGTIQPILATNELKLRLVKLEREIFLNVKLGFVRTSLSSVLWYALSLTSVLPKQNIHVFWHQF